MLTGDGMTSADILNYALAGAAMIGPALAIWNAISIASNTRKIAEVAITAELTEKNTNSMKDSLVKVTREAALLQGKQEERAAGDALKDAEARGRAEVQTQAMGSLGAGSGQPIPVTDDAARRVAEATEKLAHAAEKTIDIAEKKS